jgi:Cupin-like domain
MDRSSPQHINDEWRRWVGVCLLQGSTTESMLEVMAASGLNMEESRQEIDAARAHPYIRAAELTANRLAKRDWILSVYRKLMQMTPGALQVPRKHQLSREAFIEEHYLPSRPVVISGMFDHWPALQKWSPAYLREHFGERQIEVQTGRNSDPDYEANKMSHRRQLTLGDFCNLVESVDASNDAYLTANNSEWTNRDALADLWKDVEPIADYFESESRHPGFFWFGPKGTITPFHQDLNNNMMAQVYGRKRVRLAPLHETPMMANEQHCFSRIDGRVDRDPRYPDFAKAQVMDVEIGPGDLLFLPVGWWHYVESLSVSMTFTLNNFLLDNYFTEQYPAARTF